MKRRSLVIVAAALFLAIAGAAAGTRIRAPEISEVPVRDDLPGRLYGLGTIEARVLSRVGFEVTGTVAELLVDHGDVVPAGGLLVRLDSRQQQARMTQAQAERTRAVAGLEQTRAQLDRSKALLLQRQSVDRRKQLLVRSGAVAVEAAEDAHTELKVAEADIAMAESNRQVALGALASAEAALKTEQTLLDLHRVTAPYPALVIDRLVEPGTVVAPGQTVLVLADPRSVWAALYVDEAMAGGLALGMPVALNLRSRPGETASGRVARIGLEADRIGEQWKVYVAFDHVPEAFTLGEQVEGIIALDGRRIVTVPESVIDRRSGQSGVWLAGNDRLQWRPVAFGRRFADGRREVVGGLDAGTRIADRPAPDFSEGRRIVITETAR